MDSGDSLSVYLGILAKRWRMILLLVITAVAATVVQLQTQPPNYTAVTRVRISAPEPGEVAIYTPLGRADVRKEVEYVKNDFVEIATGLDTAWRTSLALNRVVDGSGIHSSIRVEHSPDSDFVSIVARADSADLAQRMANTHTDVALTYFGEIRAKPIAGVLKFLRDEMVRTSKELDEVNKELQEFRNRNKIGSIDDEVASYRTLITSLRTERDLMLGRGNLETAERFDALISDREVRLATLIGLTVDYRSLTSRANELESSLSRLLSKETEAKLKEEQAKNVGFIQIVEPARQPSAPSQPNIANYVVMSIFGAILLGSMLAFLIEYLKPSPAEKEPDDVAASPEVLSLG